MKKIILTLLCFSMLILSVACDNEDEKDIKGLNADDTTDINLNELTLLNNTPELIQDSLNSNNEQLETNMQLIQSEKHFQIYKYTDTPSKYYYRILDTMGREVKSETVVKAPSITVRDNIVDITIGYGTGVSQHQYYNIEFNTLSNVFYDVYGTYNNMIVYMSIPDREQSMESRRLVIQNMFDSSLLFVEYDLDFSNFVIPVESITFLNDSNSFLISYYKGDDAILTTESLSY